MKKLILINIVMTLLVAAAFATPTIYVNDASSTTGIFHLTPKNAEAIALLGPNTFQSYCLELNEYANAGSTHLFDITDEAIAGGKTQTSYGIGPNGPGPLGGDPLDPWTAYLYTGVRESWLLGYDPTIGDDLAVQKAIWYIEGEFGLPLTTGSREKYFYDLAASSGWTDTGDVVVLNLYHFTLDGTKVLDQDFVAIIPAPGAVVLGSIGVAFVGWLRRKRTL